MFLNIRVIPKSSKNQVAREGESLKVYLTKPAHDDLANKQLIELLADHFRVKRYQLKIVRGEKSKNKIVEIETENLSGA
jgi:uncharacterized protein (TIGR00251 family)